MRRNKNLNGLKHKLIFNSIGLDLLKEKHFEKLNWERIDARFNNYWLIRKKNVYKQLTDARFDELLNDNSQLTDLEPLFGPLLKAEFFIR